MLEGNLFGEEDPETRIKKTFVYKFVKVYNKVKRKIKRNQKLKTRGSQTNFASRVSDHCTALDLNLQTRRGKKRGSSVEGKD
jgi:hypothetical protein